MPSSSFQETLDFFSSRLEISPSHEDIESGEVELILDGLSLLISKGVLEGSLQIQVFLGFIVHQLREERLKELATSNFLGINTGGCTLAFDPSGATCFLRVNLTAGASPRESWEFLHRIASVAREWQKVLSQWDEFILIHTTEAL